jgi:hypothetical protein
MHSISYSTNFFCHCVCTILPLDQSGWWHVLEYILAVAFDC